MQVHVLAYTMVHFCTVKETDKYPYLPVHLKVIGLDLKNPFA